MNAQGIITKIEQDIITLEQLSDEECASCTSHASKNGISGCAACNLLGSSRRPILRAVNRTNMSLSVGDIVKIYLPPAKAIVASMNLFIIPLVAFILLFIFSGIFFPWLGDTEKAFAGIAGIGGWYGLFFIIHRVRNKKDWPVVSEIITQQE
ncbi:MAG: SoxR reducing system RseC family protein [Spirochaetales bacterium]|nr:SoxR reducing system RseC family protein [Spirochaetales bacterium]